MVPIPTYDEVLIPASVWAQSPAAPPLELIVTCPVAPDIVIFEPATIEVTIPVILVPEPVNDVAVIIPVVLIEGLPLKPDAVSALPVTYPQNSEQ